MLVFVLLRLFFGFFTRFLSSSVSYYYEEYYYYYYYYYNWHDGKKI